jgi:lipoprotein NlpI
VREAQGLALYHAGRIQQALEQFRKTWELDPTYARAPLGLALCHAALGARERVAHSMVSAWGLGAGGGCREEVADVLAGSSDPDGTLRAMRDLVGPRASDVVTHRMVDVLLSMMLADHERALASLRMARLEGSLGFMILHAPALDPLNGDARFGTLMDEAGLRLPRWRPVQGFGTGSRRATEA